MAKLNKLLSSKFENFENEGDVQESQSIEPTTIEAEDAGNVVEDAIDEVDGVIDAKEAVDEIVEQQEANLKEIEENVPDEEGETSETETNSDEGEGEGQGEGEGEGEEKEPVEANIGVDATTDESAEASADAIEEETAKEVAVMENILGGLGFKATLQKSALQTCYESFDIKSPSYNYRSESRFLSGRDKLKRQKQLYRQHHEGFVETSKRLGSAAWEGIKSMIQRIIEFITSWFKTDYKKVGMSIKEKIKELLKSGNNLKVSDSLKEYSKPTSVGAFLCLNNVSDYENNLKQYISFAQEEMKAIERMKDEDSLDDTIRELGYSLAQKTDALRPLSFNKVEFESDGPNNVYLITGSKGVKTGYFNMKYVGIESVSVKDSTNIQDGKKALELANQYADIVIGNAEIVKKVLNEFKTKVSSKIQKLANTQAKLENKKSFSAFKGLTMMKVIPSMLTDLTKTAGLIIKNVSVESK